MSNALLEIQEVKKSFDGVHALMGFSCSLREREILGLIGPNGAGKSTLFNVVTGFLPCEGGQIIFKEQNITGIAPYQVARQGISRTFQNLRLIRQVSILDNVLLSFQNQQGERLWNIFFHPRTCQKQENANREEAMVLLNGVGLTEKADDLAEDLSYGQQKLLSLACCLAAKSEVILLDEPVAGIAPEMIEKILGIIQELPSKGKSVILIEHNLDAVMQVCDRVIFMDAGASVSEGTPEEVRNDPRVIEAYIE